VLYLRCTGTVLATHLGPTLGGRWVQHLARRSARAGRHWEESSTQARTLRSSWVAPEVKRWEKR
jgi:hypothetical protein